MSPLATANCCFTISSDVPDQADLAYLQACWAAAAADRLRLQHDSGRPRCPVARRAGCQGVAGARSTSTAPYEPDVNAPQVHLNNEGLLLLHDD
jgi:hypothetical protein